MFSCGAEKSAILEDVRKIALTDKRKKKNEKTQKRGQNM